MIWQLFQCKYKNNAQTNRRWNPSKIDMIVAIMEIFSFLINLISSIWLESRYNEFKTSFNPSIS